MSTPVAVPDGTSPDQEFSLATRRTGAAIAEFPDFLRLGLLLILEHRPEEPTARRKFIELRHIAADAARTAYTARFADLDAEDIGSLVTLSIALADGLFVAREVGELDLSSAFDLLATAVLGSADQLRAAKQSRHQRTRATRR